jgi:hypothetical protein
VREGEEMSNTLKVVLILGLSFVLFSGVLTWKAIETWKETTIKVMEVMEK